MTGINLTKNLQALISIRIPLNTLPTYGKLKCDSENNNLSSNNDNNNNEQKYNYNNDNNDDNDENNSNKNNKNFF